MVTSTFGMFAERSPGYQPVRRSRRTGWSRRNRKMVDRAAVRGLDVTVASAMLLLMAPVLLVLALVIWTQDGGSPIFVHWRIGRGGRKFPCLKFRTMVVDSNERLRRILESCPASAEEWQRDHKLRNDPRVTRLGRFLRKSSLDEIPQLANVIVGHMSLVGPRPIIESEVARYGRYFSDYCSVKPGITGLWQVSGRNNTSYRRRVVLDMVYSRSKSFSTDLMVLSRTLAGGNLGARAVLDFAQGVKPDDKRADVADIFGEVILVDPSLFTAPYDARLSDGLEAAGVAPVWATRALRPHEEDELGTRRSIQRFFYPRTDGPRRRDGDTGRWLKGAEHLLGLAQLVRMVRGRRPAAIHFQWGLVPKADRLAIRLIRRICPVVFTVHDTEPFNGKDVGAAQRFGFRQMLAAADHLIVHTIAGHRALVRGGFDESRIAIVPHGLLAGAPAAAATPRGDARWTLVQFGRIQDYKGVDLLVEALGRLSPDDRSRLRVIVAGEPMIDLAPLRARASELGLDDVIDWRPSYQSNADIATLLQEANGFVFPYRAIEASGAFMLVAGAGKWIIASDLGAFAETIGHSGDAGRLVPPGDVAALADALVASIDRRPQNNIGDTIPDWAEIGRRTVEVYRRATARWRAERGRR